jgi:hypothetical protein
MPGLINYKTKKKSSSKKFENWPLKVDGNEKWGGVGKEAINQLLSGIVAIGGYFKFERAISM